MFEDYKKEVLNFYLERKRNEQLEPFLQNPTTRRLKKECIRIFNMNTKKEERLLRLFFDPNHRIEDVEESIKKFDVEKFRPLLSFIKQEKNIRDEEPVKILAWLIGFETYKEWKEKLQGPVVSKSPTSQNDFNQQQFAEDAQTIKVLTTEKTLDPLINSIQDDINKQIETTPPTIDLTSPLVKTSWRDKSINWKTWMVTLSCLTLTFVAFAFYKLNGSQQCMYWNGHEYKKTPCNEKVADVQVLALDKQKLAHLRKITQPDTITYSSMGKVWWAKVNGKVEFYTAAGDHPTIQNKRLLPITKYMIDKYVTPLRY